MKIDFDCFDKTNGLFCRFWHLKYWLIKQVLDCGSADWAHFVIVQIVVTVKDALVDKALDNAYKLVKKKEPERIIIEMTAEELIGICPSVVDYNENYTVQSLEISKMIQEEKMQNILNWTGDNLMLKNSKGSQYDEDADHSPFYGDGIIAIDACTPLSKKINCLVLEDFY